ncbi:MAG: hypothetical protein EA364_10215 [Balneolaceae bacterium]|nr:MAG: hypothetical protein EA364_10215 [Balneolaceae bacterium]
MPSKQILSEYLAAVGYDDSSPPKQLFLYGNFDYRAKGSEEPEISGSFEEFRAIDDYRLTVLYYNDSLLAVGRSPVLQFVDQPGLSNLVYIGSEAARNFDVVPFLNFVADDSAHVNPETGDWQLLMNDSDGIRWRVDFHRESFLPVKAVVNYYIPLMGNRCTFVYTYSDYELFEGLKIPARIVKSGCDYGVIHLTIGGAEVVSERLDRELFCVLQYRSLLRRHPQRYED